MVETANFLPHFGSLIFIGATTINGDWKPEIGDPTFIGWFTVLTYGITCILCGLCARETFRIPKRFAFHSTHWYWWGLTLVLLVLAINKQLDLQTWFTITAKKMALSEGWYLKRRIFQLLFIGWLIFGVLAALAWVKYQLGSLWKEFKLILGGLLFLGTFIIVRATSFHHIDQFLHFNLAGFKMNWILELTGIALVAGGAIKYLKDVKKLQTELKTLNQSN